MNNLISKITNTWFYSPSPFWMRFFLIFIKGDILVLLPLSALIGIILLFQLKIGLLIGAIYFSLRNMGEMIYWFLQQFGPKTYRPYDFGLTKLDNNALYIIYQTFALSMTTLGCFSIYLIISSIK
jgi:hypothetical protein